MYLFILTVLNRLGFKQFAVQVAYLMEDSSTVGNRMFNAAQGYLYGNTTGFPACSECYLPVLSDSDEMHTMCRAEELQSITAEEDFWASLCTMPGCWEGQVKDGFCQKDWDYHYLCGGCGKLETECVGECYLEKMCSIPGCFDDKVKEDLCQYHWDEEDICSGCRKAYASCSCDENDEIDEICDGICGQPAYACTCAETEAFRRHNADPATRGSWFVA